MSFRTWWGYFLLAVFLSITGCGAEMFACKTDASYIVRANGDKEISYSSCKEQIGLKAVVNPKTGEIDIQVDKASTQESVVAASLQMQILNMQLLQKLMPLIDKAAMAGS